ncbi:hypothetical protein VOI54_12495 [Tamlana sp. 2201CG12-4]|uniref:hypothetical protein n=1 Tax=Tamlana sp. 2201CG12-4 TaxID=3112582 RepID=UPI002DBC6BD4|nr:hypothetical protein [Tamlana sp. 2201CG12-4]MEC3907840.1 hypothetical protein [Tamlana sp. 2201CG12-4]
MTFYESLEHIKKRPKMYFQESLTLAHLDSFIYGYLTGSNGNGIIAPNGMNFEYFNTWLTGAIQKTLSGNRGWRKRIEHISKDEKHAVELFFDLIFKFGTGKVKVNKEDTEPIPLKWSRGSGTTKLEDFQKIEETIVRFEFLEHEFSKTRFKIGYNANDFKVYVEPQLDGKHLRTFRYTEIEENY